MQAPLKSMFVTGPFGEVAEPGTGLPDSSGVIRHIGVDLRASVGTPVYSMEAGTVTNVDNVGLKLVEIRGSRTIRYLHLDRNILGGGQKVGAGELVGYSGNTGGVAAHLHVDVRNNGTTYNQSFYNYYNPMALINTGSTGGQIMDTEAKVQAQYNTLRGQNATPSEVKGWIGRSYEEFNTVAKPEVNSRTQNITNLTNAVASLTKERDLARTQVATLTKEVLAERDKVAVLTASNKTLQSELDGAKQAYKELEAQHQTQIAELNHVIEIKDNEIKRLSTELANCDGESLTWSQHLVLGIKGLLSALNPINK